MTPVDFYRESYRALTDSTTFPWQEKLFLDICQGELPTEVSIPTGCGKTGAMTCWLLALGYKAYSNAEHLSFPRRLVWVVNRRVVVDQATTEAAKLKRRIADESISALDPLRLGLRRLCLVDAADPLAVSTLRGQFADNAEWRDDPSRAAIVVGTVDMIGSRLLFNGYGPGFKYRPLHAGFLGQDALLIHDEAHLEPAFQRLVAAIAAEQTRTPDFRPLRIMALTATHRTTAGKPFGLTEADRRHPEIKRRIEARKGITFHSVETENKIPAEVLQCAQGFSATGQAIVIFLRKVDDVQTVATGLRQQRAGVCELTGTIRGYERDRMVKRDPVFARFTSESEVSPAEGTAYLVCTSAGEVGINMSGDHLVSDLNPFDSMAQRLGRVNRFGTGDARVEIVYSSAGMDGSAKKSLPAEREFRERIERTRDLLQKLPERSDGRRDASPAGLEALPVDERQAAFTPPPEVVPVSDILFDAWALTSIRVAMPGRPAVADWLHGIAEWEPPQTSVAWRSEVDLITAEWRDTYPPEDLLEDYPLKPHELLRDSTKRVSQQLEKLAERAPESWAWALDAESHLTPYPLSELIELDLADWTIILPPRLGGLTAAGAFQGDEPFHEDRRYDIADEWFDEQGRQRRQRLWDSEVPRQLHMRPVRTLDLASDDDDAPEAPRRYWRWYVLPRSADDDGSIVSRVPQALSTHTELIERFAKALVPKINLELSESAALICAAKAHDLGKRRNLWQRSVGNDDYPTRILAKSGQSLTRFHTGYRHELGSLLDLPQSDDFLDLTSDERDLALHLIAAHHGRARPHFPADEVFDPESAPEHAVEIARETPRRFTRLQRKYGRWGLAFLESLLRSADALASQDRQTKPDEQTQAATQGSSK